MKAIKEQALRLANAGWKVVMLDGKSPDIMGLDWYNKASSDVDEVQAWFTLEPEANLGVVMGERNRVISIDIDAPRGGLAWWESNEHRIDAATPVEMTGRGDGSRHIYFRIPSGTPAPKTRKKFDKGVELLSTGTQVVTSPSIHPETGCVYKWGTLVDLENGVDAIPVIPEWLMEEIKSKSDAMDMLHPPTEPAVSIDPADLAALLKDIETLDDGAGRHQAIGRWIIDAVACGLEQQEIERLAGEWLGKHGRKPQEQPAEVKNWIRDARRSLRSGKVAPSGNYRVQDVFPMNPTPPAAAVKAAIEAPTTWARQLQRTESGKLKPLRINVELFLANHPDYVGLLAWNEMCNDLVLKGRPPWDEKRMIGADGSVVNDQDLICAASYMGERHNLHITINTMHEAMVSVGYRFPFHPVRNYLNTLKWDGTERVKHLFTHYMPCLEPVEYLEAVSTVLLVGAVNRVREPGCKMDYMVVMEGVQGIKKSTGFEKLFGLKWFLDRLPEIGSPDCTDAIRHKWCVEMSELEGISKADVTKIKSFLSRKVDSARLAYGRRTMEYPRQCVFVGTTNEKSYLRDTTDNRRFFPVKCKAPSIFEPMGIEKFDTDRDQLWAEADHLYNAGVKPFISDPSILEVAIGQQKSRVFHDAWEDMIDSYLSERDFVTTAEIWVNALGGAQSTMDQRHMQRIGAILHSKKWERGEKVTKGHRARGFYKPKKVGLRDDKTSNDQVPF